MHYHVTPGPRPQAGRPDGSQAGPSSLEEAAAGLEQLSAARDELSNPISRKRKAPAARTHGMGTRSDKKASIAANALERARVWSSP